MNRDPLFDVSGKAALVTGASSGLGEALARHYAGTRRTAN
jgi:NAD(P)-dependent dehydrogenase (short-subunit alcohol dehydrogenase family)